MTPSLLTLFHNCRILRDYKILRDELWVLDGKIISPESVPTHLMSTVRQVNCNNLIIAPGFIDLQINGAYGHDFTATDDIQAALAGVSARIPESGVTSYLPTIITSSPETYSAKLRFIQYKQYKGGATVLGSHIEGPYISMGKRGCHPPELVRKEGFSCRPEDDLVNMYGGNLDHTVILTLAPELPNATRAIEILTRKYGIVVSLGHSEATYAAGEAALRAGATKLTHLFSAMNAFGHKEPSLPGLICADIIQNSAPSSKLFDRILELRNPTKTVPAEKHKINIEPPTSPASSTVSEYCPSRLYFGIIADGVHTHPATLRIAHRLNKHGLCLVTDAISALGLADGEYYIGDTQVEVSGNPRKAIKKGTDTLAGVVASLDQCVR